MTGYLEKKNTARMIWWTVVILYTASIYGTLGVAVKWWRSFDSAVGGRGITGIYTLCGAAAVAVFVYMAVVRKERAVTKYVYTAGFLTLLFALSRITPLPTEKVHLLMYGALGVMVYKAISVDMARTDWRVYVLGVFLCSAIGLGDEIIQGFLPDRVFDWKDITLNAASSLTALVAIKVNVSWEIALR